MDDQGFIPHAGSESDLVARVLIEITKLPRTMAWRNNTGSLPDHTGRWISFGCLGSGDILGCRWSRGFAIETKVKLGKQRKSQENFERAWTQAGGIYILSRSLDQIVAAIRAIGA